MTFSLVLWYATLSLFSNFQMMQASDFRGASETYGVLLSLSAFTAKIVALVFLILYGWQTTWYMPIALFAINLVVQFVGVIPIAAALGLPVWIVNLIGFFAWPIAAVLLFRSI